MEVIMLMARKLKLAFLAMAVAVIYASFIIIMYNIGG
jgi:hypothetical protein